jgi:hypothetical protein
MKQERRDFGNRGPRNGRDGPGRDGGRFLELHSCDCALNRSGQPLASPTITPF